MMQLASRQPLWREGLPGRGTVLVVLPEAGNMTVCISTGTLANGSDSVTVDWGDGTVEELPMINMAKHTYRRIREYRVKISDDLKSFGFSNYSMSEGERDRLIELVRAGEKVTSITGYGFNNCHKMRGVINLPNVTSIGGYAFGTTLGITDYFLPSMTRLVQTSFYAGSTPTRMYVDNVTQIDGRFFEYYGRHLEDMFIRQKTRAQIKAMSGFPFRASASVRFHGSDGIVLGDGLFV